jgi:hypothetical protein
MPVVSKKQQQFMGMVDAFKKGKTKGASSAIKKAAESMTSKQVHDFAATKTKGLPLRKKKSKNALRDRVAV